jgi:hypothetical protein
MARLVICLIMLSLSLGQPALASPPPLPKPGSLQALTVCFSSPASHFYAADTQPRPAILSAIFEGPGASFVVRSCADADHNTHYFLRLPGVTRAGVCEIYEEEIFPADSLIAQYTTYGDMEHVVKLKGWSREMPQEWRAKAYPDHTERDPFAFAQLANGACPRADDAHYVPIRNVPPGVFRVITETFDKSVSSEAHFNDALADASIGFPKTFMPRIYELSRNAHVSGYVRCDDRNCQAELSNGFVAGFDMRGGSMKMISLHPHED